MREAVMNRSKRSNWKFVKSEVIKMYQIYSLLTIVALLWGHHDLGLDPRGRGGRERYTILIG